MRIAIGALEANYIEEGKGEVVLLLHGWGSNLTLYAKMIQHLSMSHRVLALDFPGFGGSEEPKTPWNVDDYVDFTLEFLRLKEVKSVTLVGHSFGGRVIIKLVNRPDLPVTVKRLILIDAAGIKPGKTLKKTLRTRTYKLVKGLVSLKLIRFLYPNLLETARKHFGSADYNAASPVMRGTLVRAVNEDLTGLLPGIKQPTLLIWGELDQDTPLSAGKKMEELIPDSGLVTIKGAGHYSFLEQSDQVHRILDAFLTPNHQPDRRIE